VCLEAVHHGKLAAFTTGEIEESDFGFHQMASSMPFTWA
jgi:hypothetical protein